MRERWYALHRARRVFRREQAQRAMHVGRFGRRVDVDLKLINLLVNPPLIVDYSLPNCGFPPVPPYRPLRSI